MRVSTKMIYGNFELSFARSEEIINKTTKQINSGKRIEKPSDDPYGTARAMSYRTGLTELSQYIDNSNKAISWLNIADDTLITVNNHLQRVREIVISGANDSLTKEGLAALAAEIDEISAGIMQLSNANIDERYIFAGEKVSNNAYQMRNPVSGNVLDLAINPIDTTLTNQFQIKLDNRPAVTITLPVPRIYDGTPGNTLEDLASDIRTQLRTAGLLGTGVPNAVEVNVKATSDNKLVFYAGTTPPDGQAHTLVLRQGAVDDVLGALGFNDYATTKEIVGYKLNFPLNISATYPVAGTGTFAGDTINLDPASFQGAGYYDNWTLMIDDNGTVQTRTVAGGSLGNSVDPTVPWAPPLTGPNIKYFLSPPLAGQVGGVDLTGNTVTLANGSTVDDFYVGMPITITDGAGKNQTRTITGYTGGVVTVDSPFQPPPDVTSRYAIDANSHTTANNKFRIAIPGYLPQEISLDGADYTPAQLAQMIQTKIQERGGPYQNIQVSITSDNELRFTPVDTLADNPVSFQLESGSTADGLWLLGVKNGAVSNEMVANYEGNKGGIEYEVNVGVKLKINQIGERIFDPIFQHLAKISLDLRAGNTAALSDEDLRNVKADIQNVLLTESEIGAKTNRMEKGIERFLVLDENLNKLLGDVEDVDITKAIMQLKLQQTAYQAALQVGAQIMPLSLLDYLR